MVDPGPASGPAAGLSALGEGSSLVKGLKGSS
jgi:hypothetical protein